MNDCVNRAATDSPDIESDDVRRSGAFFCYPSFAS